MKALQHMKSELRLNAILALLVAVCALGPITWGQIQQPILGTMLTRDGAPRAVFGVSGSVTMGDPPAAGDPASGGVLSMGCSRTMCLLKTDSSILSYVGLVVGSVVGSQPGVVDAPKGPALFWFEGVTGGNVNAAGGNVNAGANGNAAAAGNSALVYFPGSRQLARWQNGRLSPIDFDVTGEILSIGEASDGTLQFAIRNQAGTWIVRNGDAIVQSLGGPAGSDGPVLLLHGGVLFATRDGLVLRRPDASEMVFNLDFGEVEAGAVEPLADGRVSATASGPPPSGSELRLKQVALSWLGENYVQARVHGSSGNSNYAVRIDLGRERIFLLPEPQP